MGGGIQNPSYHHNTMVQDKTKFSIFDIFEKSSKEMEHAVFIIENQSAYSKSAREYFQIKINSYLNGS